MPICLRRSIDRADWISPSRELIDSCISSEPGVIHYRADSTDSTSRIIVVSTCPTISITNISYITIRCEIFSECALSETDTEHKCWINTLGYTFLYPDIAILEITTRIGFEEFFLTFSFLETIEVEKTYRFLQTLYIRIFLSLFEIIDVFPSVSCRDYFCW